VESTLYLCLMESICRFGSTPFNDLLLHLCAHLLHPFTLSFPMRCKSTLGMSSV
jgi:hypothetical protein